MVGERKLWQLLHLLNVSRETPGDFVELGAWRGGVSILARAFYHVHDEPRTVYVCDSFEGLPLSLGESADFADAFLSVPLDEVSG